MGKLKLLDLFSGIGGFSLGLERSGGFETVAFCEIDPFCRRVLAKHWPEVPQYDDVRTISAERLAADGIAVDAICGGFPCQDVSVANIGGQGLDGERSGLWFEYFRLISELRPKLVVVENVAGLLDRGLDQVLGCLASIGYDAEWHCIPASALGAPHRRDRIWIVAYPEREGWERPEPVTSFLGGALAQFAEHGNPFADAWGFLDSGFGGLRTDDGLSVAMERRRLHALGNAVVPQIPELLGRAVLRSIEAA